MEKVIKIKSWIVSLYYFSLYLPIFVASFMGVKATAGLNELKAATFLSLFFAFIVITALIIFNFRKKYSKIANYVFLISSFLLLVLILIAKTSGDALGISFFLQIIFISYFALVVFSEKIALNILDSISKFINKLFDLLREKEENNIE